MPPGTSSLATGQSCCRIEVPTARSFGVYFFTRHVRYSLLQGEQRAIAHYSVIASHSWTPGGRWRHFYPHHSLFGQELTLTQYPRHCSPHGAERAPAARSHALEFNSILFHAAKNQE